MNEVNIPEVVSALSRVQAGYLPADLFFQVSRLTVVAAVEVVPLRYWEGECQVLLTQRPANDPYWPGQWHNPGSIMRPTDEPGTFASAIERVCVGELGLTSSPELTFVAPWFWHGARGSVVSLVHWLDVSHVNNIQDGTFYSVHNLPADLISGMQPILNLAIEHYTKHTT